MEARRDLPEYNRAQRAVMSRWVRETARDPIEWDRMGYAAAFEKAYYSLPPKVRDDGRTLYEVTLATAGKVGTILG